MNYSLKKVIMKYSIFQRLLAIIFVVAMIWSSIFTICAIEQEDLATAPSIIKVFIKDGVAPYKEYSVPQLLVKEALDYLGINLNKSDKISSGLEEKITENIKIKIERIRYKKVVKNYKIKFKTKKKKTTKLYVGQKKIQVKGKNGLKQITYLKKIKNEKTIKVKKIKTKVIKKPRTKVVLVGIKRKNTHMIAYNPTKVKTTSKGGAGAIYDANGKKIAYTYKLSGYATAYSYDAGSLTATGEKVHIGGVAVNPNQIPYGSRLYIESPDGRLVYGYARAIDTGGFAYNGSGTIVDLFYPSYSDCEQFGRRIMNIYVLK